MINLPEKSSQEEVIALIEELNKVRREKKLCCFFWQLDIKMENTGICTPVRLDQVLHRFLSKFERKKYLVDTVTGSVSDPGGTGSMK